MVSDLFFYQLALIALVWLCRHAPLGVAKRPRHCVPADTGAPTPTAKAQA